MGFIDWVLALPPDVEKGFWVELSEYEEERRMRYVLSVERIAREEGLQEGREEGLQEGRQEGLQEGLLQAVGLGLRLRFGEAGLALMPMAQGRGVEVLSQVKEALAAGASLEEVHRLLCG